MSTNASQTSVSPAAVWRMLKRRGLYLLLPVILLTPAIAYYALKLPPKYRAHALVGAEPLIPGQPASAARVDASVLGAQEQTRAIREMLLSPQALETVTREFHLDTPAPNPGAAKEDLRSRIQIQLETPDTFDVGFESSDAKQAADVSNRLANLFVARTSALRGQAIEQHDTALDQEVERTQRLLNIQEEGLRAFKERISQELPERLATNLKEMENLHQQIQSKSEQITEAEARRSSINEELKALEKQGVLQVEPPAKSPSQIALEDLRIKLGQLKARYTPEHPEILRLQQEIHDLEASATPVAPAPRQPSPAQMRYIALQSELKSIDPKLTTYREEREALMAQTQEFEQRISSTPALETSISERTKDAAMLRARYETLYAKQQEARLTKRTNPTDNGLVYRVLEPATVPPAPYSPHSNRIILFGMLAAFGLGVLGVVVAEKLDATFETGDQVEAATSLPILSAVPTIPQKATGKKTRSLVPGTLFAAGNQLTPDQRAALQKQRLIVLSDPQSVGAQQYGILALKVWRWLGSTGGRTLLVTSPAGEEGKSLTALNLSLALAATLPGRVLLVDADLRRPQVVQRLGLPDGKGFSELLESDAADPEPYIAKIGSLDVIGSGAKPSNPATLLASQSARDILAKLRDRYQVIVLDSPPVVPVPDSHVLAGLADGVMLVVRARQTRQELLLRAAESLSGARMTVVLNDVDYAATPYAHAYQYQ
jgi:polysaccharide biosynthesis transport protein